MEKIIERKKHIIDAKDQILGRLASKAALFLRGKHKADFNYHQDKGDFVEIINADQIKVSGKKLDQKLYHKHSGWIGHLKTEKMSSLFEKNPAKIIKLAVYGMLPKNKLRAKMMARLVIHKGSLGNR